MFFRLPMLLAQLDADAQLADVKPAQVLAGMLVLSVMVGSVAIIVLWIKRLQQGQSIFPAANRKPLIVPLPLMVCGVALASLLALSAVQQSLEGASPIAPVPPPVVTDITDDVADEEQDGADQKATSELESGEAVEIDNPAPARPTEAQVITGMLGNLAVQLAIFLIFGAPLLLAQQLREQTVVDEPTPPFDTPDASFAAMADVNPYASTSYDALPEHRDSHIPPNPFIDGADSQVLAEPEGWRFTTELRFAVETCLAAYLPLALIRLAILSLQPEAPSHPLIEMMGEGVSFRVMALIALLAIVVAPVVEELLYRVTVLGGFMKQQSLAAGWIVSSVLFSFAHGFPDSLALLPLAFALGYAYMKRRSYRTVVLVHFIFNAFNMAVAGLSLL
ncbi:CPBP family intramembrane glutamic endopeptidase [Fuerstiella marisgermanici]|uniref:CPBP family intramembrane glutamic endopeptidase n=1 Tax=Fuerstiella marisgermanici TaxID=1891926 RepID=UPI0011AB4547|nr:CPBP family intramembrane glutamic endopeptidase [Fuerstiella marisgermanici]